MTSPPQYQQPVSQQQMGSPMYAQPIAYTSPGTVIIATPGPMYGSWPVNTTCPYCRAQVQTSIRKQSGVLVWLSCAGLALLGLFWGCCLIPFCIDGLKDTEHYCPSCQRLLYRKDAC